MRSIAAISPCCRPHRCSSIWSISVASGSPVLRRRLEPQRGRSSCRPVSPTVPTDLDVVVLSTPAGAARWEWIKWLPHARGSHGVQFMSDDEAITDWINAQRTLTTVVASIQSLGRPITPSRLTLAVVDDPALWRGRAAMLRGLFAEAQLPVRFVAITDRADDVPAVCTTVVRIEANGSAEVDYPISGPTITDVVPFVLEHDVAVAAARKLSPLEDPHRATSPTKARPATGGVVGVARRPRWARCWPYRRAVGSQPQESPAPRRCRDPANDGPVDLDLADDGPHGLIVGAPRSRQDRPDAHDRCLTDRDQLIRRPSTSSASSRPTVHRSEPSPTSTTSSAT